MKSKYTYMQEKITEDEFNRLLDELGYGTSLNPDLVEIAIASNKKEEAFNDELLLVEEWQLQDELKEFEEPIFHKSKPENLSFMCKAPSGCESFQNFGSNCACIRKSFRGPSDFESWAQEYIKTTKNKLVQEIGKYKNENKD